MRIYRGSAASRHAARQALLAFTLLAGPLLAAMAQTPSHAKALRKHPVRSQVAQQEVPAESAEPVPQPIPRMTAYDLATEPPVVTYAAGHLTVDSGNTTLGEALTAISRKTRMLVDSPVASSERFAAHYSGTPRQVLGELLTGSEFGYVLVAANSDPAYIEKVILTRIVPKPSGEALPTPAHPGPGRVAMYVAPEAVAERRGETILDMSNKPSETAEPTQTDATLPQPTSQAGAAAQSGEGATPPGSSSQAEAEERKKVNAAGQYMQELYKMRLEQQQRLQGSSGTPPPQ